MDLPPFSAQIYEDVPLCHHQTEIEFYLPREKILLSPLNNFPFYGIQNQMLS